jgi:glycosyltransferase involved in cell wall biosynthesis
MAALIRDCHIGVQTSHSEGLSIALLERMMAGLAVVATDVGDTSRAVIHEQTGLLVKPGDVDQLVHAMRRLLIDPDLRARLGRAAREHTHEHFGATAVREAALRDYAYMLGPGR